MRFDVHPTMMKQKQGAPCGRTLKNPRTITICTTERFPIGNALFLFAGGMMRLFRLPCSKLLLAFLAVPAGKDGRVVGEVYLIFVGAILQQPLFYCQEAIFSYCKKQKHLYNRACAPVCAGTVLG
ncbi:MAG: hypothetical protein V8S25_00580 [Faecalibacterium prausnitzii]